MRCTKRVEMSKITQRNPFYLLDCFGGLDPRKDSAMPHETAIIAVTVISV